MRDLSAVVAVGENASITDQLIGHLLDARAEHVVQEVLVLCDGAREGVARLLVAPCRDVAVIFGDFPTASSAWNAGVERAGGADVLLLDGDELPVGDPIDRLRAYAGSRPEAGVIGSRIVAVDDRIRHAGVVVGQDDRPHVLYAGFDARHAAVCRSRRLQATLLGGALVRRTAFLACGGLAPELAADWAALDLCGRMLDGGAEVHVCHAATWWLAADRPLPFRGEWPTGRDGSRRAFARDDLDHYVADGLLRESYAGPHPSRLSISSVLASVDRAARRRGLDDWQKRSAEEIRALASENDDLRQRARGGDR